jgi:hypothetical protein
VKTGSCFEEIGDLLAGFNGFHLENPLDTQTLTPFCAASRKNGTAALGCHTSTKTVALCALAIIWLVGTLHNSIFLNKCF